MKLLLVFGSALASAALLAAPSGATMKGISGDTCTSTGSGTTYTIDISLPQNATEQGTFALKAGGAQIKTIKATGYTSKFTTSYLPAGTTGAVLLTQPPSAMPGSQIAVTVVTTAPVKGSFAVAPATASTTGTSPTWFDLVTCQLSKGTPPPSKAFSIKGPFVYSSATGTWSAWVTVPGPGHVNIAGKSSPKSLIHDRTYAARGAGKVKITLVPTTFGKTALSTGPLRVHLSVEFSPRNGTPATKLIWVTLRKM